MMRYAAGVAGGFLVLAVGWVGLFFWSFGLYEEFGDRNLAAWYQIKREAATAHPGQRKILLAGGSNVLYGLQSAQLERELRVPCVNYGTHAGLPLDYLLYRWKKALRPGDLLVLSLEWEFLDRAPDEVNSTFAGYLLGAEPEYFWSLGLKNKAALIFGSSLRRLLLPFFLSRLENAKIQGVYREWILAYFVDRKGDYFRNDPARADQNGLREILAAGAGVGVAEPTMENARDATAFWRTMEQFVQWARKRGVEVVFAAPSVLQFPEFADARYREFFRAAEAHYAALGIPVISPQAENIYAPDLMLDSPYHLNSKGTALRTHRLAKELKPTVTRYFSPAP